MGYWYGFHNAYGNRSRMDGSRVGRVHVFGTKGERDAWVEADRYDGDFHREAIGSREALRLMVDGLSRLYPDTDFGRLGTDELVEAYRSWHWQ